MAEQREGVLADVSLEVTTEAARLAGRGGRVEAVVFGGGAEIAVALGRHGAAAMRRIDAEGLDAADPRQAVLAVERLVAEEKPSLVLFGATRLGSELAARLAVRLDAALLARCNRLDIGPDGRVQGERFVYRGRATATVARSATVPVLATINPGVLPARPRAPGQPALVRDVRLDLEPRECRPAVRVEGSWRLSPWEMELEEAETVVAGGLGLASRADFEMLAELAGILGGALGASRPVVDAGVAPYHRQVGISGRVVSPRLYIACAISGSVHHVGGMKGSGAVIAINSDRHAPIFQLADLGIVGDAREIVPALIAGLRRGDCSARPAAVEQVVGALAGSMQGGRP